jgi:glucose/arabinose dehydrogenase
MRTEYSALTEEGETWGPQKNFAYRFRCFVLSLLLFCVLVAIASPIYFVLTRSPCLGVIQVPNATIAEGWCAHIIFSEMEGLRDLHKLDNGDMLMLERNNGGTPYGRIWLVYHDNSTYEKLLLISDAPTNCTDKGPSACINHAVTYFEGYIYASSDSTIYRWKYDVGGRTPITDYEIALTGIPPRTGTHKTRTLLFDKTGNLFVTVGALGNVDPDSSHAEIRRFDFSNINNQPLPVNYSSGLLWAAGTRNEVGIAFDDQGRLWGVENGIDGLERPDLGPNLSKMNPAEELNLLDGPEKFYGYPYCWSEFELPPNVTLGRGTQWVTPEFLGNYSDFWCRGNSIAPKYSLNAHCAPLDLQFYYGSHWPYNRSLFITRHGSGTGQGGELVGFDILRLDFDEGNDTPKFGDVILEWQRIHDPGMDANTVGANWHRFVALEWGSCIYGDDCLYFTSDNGRGPLKGVFGVLSRSQ